MVLTNSASRSRNMVQTNNQPQAVDFGSIFPSVAVSAYGARNRRQRGIYNIDFLSANRPKINQSSNVGRNVTGVRGSAGNVLGTSAHSRLIDDVTFSTQRLAIATAAELTANTVFSDASDNREINGVELGYTAIDNILTAINGLTDASVGYLNNNEIKDAVTNTNTDDTIRTDYIANFNALKTFNTISVNTGNYTNIDYDNLSSASDLSIYDIRDINKALQQEFVSVKAFIGNTLGLDVENGTTLFNTANTKIQTANTRTQAAFDAEMAYKAAYDNEIATNNAQSAAQAELATANSRLY